MFRIIAISLIVFLYSNLGNAQDIPTIDDVNKNQPKLPAEQKISPSEKLELDQSQKLEKNEDQILKILVKDFKFDGNLYYSNQELEEVIKEAVNKELVYDQLINVTRAISNHYKANGFLATAFLPPQDINDGVIKIKITEAVLGTIIFDVEEEEKLNISKENIRLKLLYKIEDSGVLNIDQLDKNVRNLNKIPGINALAELEEGKNFGETNVKVTTINTETIFGNTLVDNNGSRSSGYNKITNTINIDGLFNMGDRLAFTNVLSGDHHVKDNHEESNYYAVSSTMPVGYNGMLATLRVSKMEYKLSAPFDSTKPSGYSSEYNLSLNRPLIVSPNFNLNTSFSLGNNKYVNDLGTGNNSDKDVLKSIFNLGFDSRDERLGGGINYGSFALSLAKNDLTDNLSNYETDQSTSDNNGRNFKGTLNLNRMQKLTDKTNLLVKFNGQLAADNLDGADQFSLGGPNAVRAYPSSEAAGDAGFVASLELKRNLFKNLESTLFYDYGKIKLHKSLWKDWNSTNKLKNNYHLQGYGISVGIPIFQNFSINATHAKKIGSNSGRDSSGNDVDGFSWKDRSLISINGKF
jgi:hemolysin activation/secretion protein